MVMISSKIILDQDHFCIEVFLERKGEEIQSESDFITSVCCGGECYLKEEKMITRKGKELFPGDYIFP